MNAVVMATGSHFREAGKWDLTVGWFGNGKTLLSLAKHQGPVLLTDCFFPSSSHTRTRINQMGLFSSSVLIYF